MSVSRYKKPLGWVIWLAPLIPYLLRPGFVSDYLYPFLGCYLLILLLWAYARWSSWPKAVATVGICVGVGLMFFSLVYFTRHR